nr:sodium/calcium exchanger NCL2-like [Tanacetum cinerariifolium]
MVLGVDQKCRSLVAYHPLQNYQQLYAFWLRGVQSVNGGSTTTWQHSLRERTMYTPCEAESIATEQRSSDRKMLLALGIAMLAPMAESLNHSVQNVFDLAAMSSFFISFMLVLCMQSELQVKGKNELLH